MTDNKVQELLDDIEEMKTDKVGASQILAWCKRTLEKAVKPSPKKS